VSNFNSLIAFSDNYTDDNRFNYFGVHNGSGPSAGTFLPELQHGRWWSDLAALRDSVHESGSQWEVGTINDIA
jgi:hypothetical protein